MSVHNIALCLFGSAARGDADELSDKDLLVVTDAPGDIPDDVAKAWLAEGWSPSFFTWHGMLRKAVRGDLFLQQLKQEGVILDDPTGKLGRLLEDYRPKVNYDEDTSRALIFLRAADRRSDDPWLNQSLCQAVFRFLRFYIINTLANQQRYIFGFKEGARAFSDHVAALSEAEMTALSDVYDIQRSYGTGQLSAIDAGATLNVLRGLIERLTEFEFIELPARAEARSLLPYSTLRDIEARILAYASPPELDKGELIPDIWKLVKNPVAENWAANGEVNETTLKSINDAISNMG